MPFFFAIAVPLLVQSQRTPAALKGWAALVRHRRTRTHAVADLQLRQPRPGHAVARRRHWPRPVGRQLARTLDRDALQTELTDLADVTRDRARVDSPRRRYGSPQRTARPRRCCNTSTSGATSGRSGTRPPIRWSAPARASTPTGIPARHALANISADPIGHVRRRLTRRRFRPVGRRKCPFATPISTRRRPG